MLLNLNKALSKSVIRHIFVGVGFIVTAMQTYLAKGNHIGYNTETFVGVGIQLVIVLLPVMQRYVDKNDPALGAPTKEALALLQTKLEPMTEPKPTADGVPVQVASAQVDPTAPIASVVDSSVDTTPGANA